MFAFGEKITVLTAGYDDDPYSGELVQSWEFAPTGIDWPNVAVADSGSVEPLNVARTPVDSDFTLYFPSEATVTSDNRVIVRGLTCEVVGRPFLWSNPFTGWTPGLVVQCKIREG